MVEPWSGTALQGQLDIELANSPLTCVPLRRENDKNGYHVDLAQYVPCLKD